MCPPRPIHGRVPRQSEAPGQASVLVTEQAKMEVVSADFEVFGKVQGCNFPKVAKDQADSLGISGWIKNTKTGTILGRMQGTREACDQMTKWLNEEGSPGSMIERCDIRNEKKIVRPDYQKFSVTF